MSNDAFVTSFAKTLNSAANAARVLGSLVAKNSSLVKSDGDIQTIIDDIKIHIGSRVDNPTIKVYLSQLRGIFRAIVHKGYKPEIGLTFSEVYKAAPKGFGQNSGGKRGPKHKNGPVTITKMGTADDIDNIEDTVTVSKPKQTPEDIARMVWGVGDAESVAAIQWIMANHNKVLRYVGAEMKKPAPRSRKKAA